MVVKSFGTSMSEEKSSAGVLNFLYDREPTSSLLPLASCLFPLPSSLFSVLCSLFPLTSCLLSPVSCLKAKKT